MNNKRKGLWIIIFVLLFLFAINPKTISYFRAKMKGEAKTMVVVKEVDNSDSSQIVIEKMGEGLLKYLGSVLTYYDMEGNMVWSISMGISHPSIKVSKDSAYVVDHSKNQIIRISKKGEIIYRSTLEKPIFNFVPCSDNYIAIYHRSMDPIEYVTIINEEGKKTGEIALGEGKVSNIALSKVHDRVALSTLGLGRDLLEANLLIYDLAGNLISMETLGNHMILHIDYDERGNLIVVDESNVFSLNKNGKENWKVFVDDQIKQVAFNGQNLLVFYSESKGKNNVIHGRIGNRIKILPQSNQELREIILKEEVKGIDVFLDYIIAYSSRTLYMIDKKGNVHLEKPYSSDIIGAYVFSSKDMVTITKEKTYFIKIQGS